MPGIAGLSVHLGICRRTFITYCQASEHEDEERRLIAFECLRARARIEAAQERGLFDKWQHRGAAFSLTVNHGWSEADGAPAEERFEMKTIAPVEHAKAIPKWENEE